MLIESETLKAALIFNDKTGEITVPNMREVFRVIDSQPPFNPWRRVEDGDLPKETGRYIVYLRQGTEVETPEWMGGEPLSYVTEMGFDKGQMLWQEGDDAYNAVLDLVDTEKEFHVTHWMEVPEPPKEEQ